MRVGVFMTAGVMQTYRRYASNYDRSLMLKNIAKMCCVDTCEFYLEFTQKMFVTTHVFMFRNKFDASNVSTR